MVPITKDLRSMKKRDIFSAIIVPAILTEVMQTSSPLIIIASELVGTV